MRSLNPNGEPQTFETTVDSVRRFLSISNPALTNETVQKGFVPDVYREEEKARVVGAVDTSGGSQGTVRSSEFGVTGSEYDSKFLIEESLMDLCLEGLDSTKQQKSSSVQSNRSLNWMVE